MANAVVDGVVREALIANTARLQVGGAAREVLIAETGKLEVDQVVREVLVTSGTASARQYAVSVVS